MAKEKNVLKKKRAFLIFEKSQYKLQPSDIIFSILKEPHAKSFKIFLIWSLLLWKNHLFSQSDLLLVYF